MKCNSECPFYGSYFSTWGSQYPECKLHGWRVGDIPDDCSVEDARISKMKELLGIEYELASDSSNKNI
jgi:hypothetical protein